MTVRTGAAESRLHGHSAVYDPVNNWMLVFAGYASCHKGFRVNGLGFRGVVKTGCRVCVWVSHVSGPDHQTSEIGFVWVMSRFSGF